MRSLTLTLGLTLFAACGANNVALDGGAPDAGRVCQWQNGRPCDLQIGCADDSGCHWSGCRNSDTTPSFLAYACVLGDMGARTNRSCTSRADCLTDESCAYDAGCAGHGICTWIQACSMAPMGVSPPAKGSQVSICDCAGATKTVTFDCGVEQRYQHYGDCL